MKSRSRIRKKNPAELVLMGANPMKRNPAELVLMGANPSLKYAIRWNTGRISQGMDSESEAKKLLKRFHGKGRVIRINPMDLRGTNPLDSPDSNEAQDAREIRSGFVHKESRNFIVVNEPHIKRSGDYAELGVLHSLSVKPVAGGEVKSLNLESQEIRVISDTTRRQLFFVGRVQLGMAQLQQFNRHGGNVIELGECREIIYLAKKYHPEVGSSGAGRTIEWQHHFGEENNKRPTLYLDTTCSRLILRGGDYRVEDAGLIN